MPYVHKNWAAGETIEASEMQNIQTGIQQANTALQEAQEDIKELNYKASILKNRVENLNTRMTSANIKIDGLNDAISQFSDQNNFPVGTILIHSEENNKPFGSYAQFQIGYVQPITINNETIYSIESARENQMYSLKGYKKSTFVTVALPKTNSIISLEPYFLFSDINNYSIKINGQMPEYDIIAYAREGETSWSDLSTYGWKITQTQTTIEIIPKSSN